MRASVYAAFAAVLVLLAWHLIADRMTPYTSQARVKAVVIPIAPQVSGPIVAVGVAENQLVEEGEALFRIDTSYFEVAVARAEAQLELATQEVGAGSAGVESAQSRLVRARSDLENVQVQSARVFELERKELVPIARADDTRAKLAAAEAEVGEAEAELEQQKAALGVAGEGNPRIAAALADLEKARLDLDRSVLAAPTAGYALGQEIEVGQNASAGKPAMTFISTDAIWVEAYMTENNLGRVAVGDRAELALDSHPGRIVAGVVAALPGAVSTGSEDKPGELPKAEKASGWLRQPQRFPLLLRLEGYEAASDGDDLRTLFNGQADVIVYADDGGIMAAVGAFWIRLNAWASYAW